jgi:lipid-A-disaccharide synthase
VLLPGSRRGEIARHLAPLVRAVEKLGPRRATYILAAPFGFSAAHPDFFGERLAGAGRDRGNAPAADGTARIQVIEGETWDAIGHADVALAASGTVTIETALLGTPMVTFYRVTTTSWLLGKLLVRVPFYSMVNLVAGRAVVRELIQDELNGERLAVEAARLLDSVAEREQMRRDLAEVAGRLAGGGDPLERAAEIVADGLMRGKRQTAG